MTNNLSNVCCGYTVAPRIVESLSDQRKQWCEICSRSLDVKPFGLHALTNITLGNFLLPMTSNPCTQDFIFEQPRLSVFVFATVNKHDLLADTSGLLLPWPGFYLSMKQMISSFSKKTGFGTTLLLWLFFFLFCYTFPFLGLMDETKECFGLAIDSDNICCCC